VISNTNLIHTSLFTLLNLSKVKSEVCIKLVLLITKLRHRVLHETLPVILLVNKLLDSYETRKFITVFKQTAPLDSMLEKMPQFNIHFNFYVRLNVHLELYE
jgi:hypothetical protein